MKIKYFEDHFTIKKSDFKQFTKIMRISLFLFVAFTFQMMATNTNAQNAMVNLQKTSITVGELLSEIESQTNYLVVYSNNEVNTSRKLDIKTKSGKVSDYLQEVFGNTDINYDFENNYIVLAKKANNSATAVKDMIINTQQNGVTISGTVVDNTNEPVIGATILVEGDSSKGTVTDYDGLFTMSNIPQNAVLVVSYVGMRSQKVNVDGKTSFNIVLEEDTEMLDELVVTALGIKRSEKALSYNVQKVDGEDLVMVRDANFMNSLAGKVAGVQINSSSSGAGGSSRVVMRGVKSINSSNLALYVIDGVPMYNMINGGAGASVFSEQPGTDGVADLNPDDIESISMLTGPSAAALYGNAAAAGVVMITTRKGLENKTSVNYSNSTTFSTVNMMPEMQTTYGNLPNQIESWGNKIENSTYNPRDFFRTGTNVTNSVSLSTGNKNNQTYVSAAVVNAQNILPNSGYNRYNFTARNTTSFLNDKMVLDLGANYILQDDKNMLAQGYYYNPLPALYLFPRSENFDDVRVFERYNSALDAMEQFWPYGNVTDGMQNPYWIQERQIRENKKVRHMLNASLKYDITDWFNILGRVKVDNYENRNTYKMYASTDRLFSGENGNYRDVQSTMRSTYADVLATINKNIDDWSFNVNLGASINDNQYETIGYDGGLKIPNFFAVHNIAYAKGWKSMQEGWHDQSQAVYANAEIGWKSMLYLTATGRNDWESRLAFSDYKSFFYPSVGLSAIISSMFDAPDWLTYLKVRASYTEVGNSYDRFMTTVSYPFNPQNMSWNTSSNYPNTNLKPERTKSYEFGIDSRLLDNISFNLTYYRSNTFNQTFFAELAPSSGYSFIPIQSGNIMNQGVEMTLGFDKTWNDFSLSTNYTLTWNENKVVELADGAYNYATGEPIDMQELPIASYGNLDARLILRVGGSMGDIYSQKTLARDLNGYILDDPNNGLQLENEESFLGSIFPKANMGWNTVMSYKGISLGMTFNARIGGIVLSETQSNLDRYGVSKASAIARDNGGIPINQGRVSAQDYYQTISGASKYYNYSATNVRLGELSINYTLPKTVTSDKLKATVGLVGKNLWMIYCKAPFDPELTSSSTSNFYQGFDSYMLPSTRNIGFNVKLQF